MKTARDEHFTNTRGEDRCKERNARTIYMLTPPPKKKKNQEEK